MKKEILLVITSFFLISLTAITGVYAIEEKQKVVTISKQEADITGDGKVDVILLKGIPYQNETSFLKEIFIEVKASNSKTYTFPLESGSKAALELVDLNHDMVKDIFATVLTGGSGGIVATYLYSLKDFEYSDLSVPDPLEMDAKFLNGYKAEIKLTQTGKSYLFDLKDRKRYYTKLGLYHNAMLNEPTELTVNPYNSLTPVRLKDGRMGLRGVQRVTGIANADTIAYVESTWFYHNGQWKFISAEVKKEEV
ncbi:hypothetical protein ACFVSW_01645 [Neobacillus sp. NPDC058068]|uniref:hypothetical protein n=1 Tax=Neobacillus sp. NPDC058068 TaxID=3346325 RepID=UPI0036D97C05